MSPAEALELIKDYASLGRVYFEPHALQQMFRRGATKEDVFAAIETATTCLKQENKKWKVCGQDIVGDELTIIVSLEGMAVIVTIF